MRNCQKLDASRIDSSLDATFSLQHTLELYVAPQYRVIGLCQTCPTCFCQTPLRAEPFYYTNILCNLPSNNFYFVSRIGAGFPLLLHVDKVSTVTMCNVSLKMSHQNQDRLPVLK